MRFIKRRKRRVGLKEIGPDGLFTFLLSHAALLASGGLLLGYLCVRVFHLAARAPCHVGDASTCLVFGMKLGPNGRLPMDYTRRLDRVSSITQRATSIHVVLLGGRTSDHPISEAAAGEAYLRAHAHVVGSVQLEEGSRHTLENLKNVMNMGLDGQRASLLTNRYHLARCMFMARGLGLDAVPCAAEDRFIVTPRQIWVCLREAYLLHWYVVGRAWACLTSNKAMLARIGECRHSR